MSVGDLPGALFFYGVLRPGLASGRMAELIALLGRANPATVAGRLYAVPDPRGHYPVMMAAETGERVHGAVLIPGPRFGPAEFDAFESFGPADPAHSDYLRRSVLAEPAAGNTVEAHAYCWSGSARLLLESPHRRRFHPDRPRRLRPLPRRERGAAPARLKRPADLLAFGAIPS